MPQAQLWCIDVTGAPTVVTKRIFCINFEPSHNFEDIRNAIAKELAHQNRDVKPSEIVALDVWKLDPSISRNDARFNENTSTTYTDLKEHVMTISSESGNMGEIYLDLPEDESLHLIVSLKGAPEAEGTIDLLCSELLDIKFEENRAKHREWLDSLGDQGFEERIDVIAKRRKGEDPFKEIPIAILHPAFDRFLLGMHDPDLDIPPELYSEAVEFSSTCWQVFGSKNMDEPTKKAKKLQAIEKMLGYQLLKRTKEGAAFDGLLLVEGIYPALIFLSEDDIGVQLMGRCETLYSKCMRLASLDDVRKTISLPCFLVVVSGSHISVVGAACPSMHPSIEYLTGFYVCTSMPSDPGAVFENIAKLFACLRRSINVLTEYYKDLLSLLPCLPKRYLPLRNTFTTLDGQLKRINYSNLHMLGKNIWTGTVDTPDSSSVPVLVKFTRRYCAAAHNLLKSAGLAPKLYHYDFEPYQVEEDGNDVAPGLFYWRMIVMEYISNAVTLYDLTGTASDARQIAEHLRRAVDSLHMNNYVFGDLRPTNIMVQILEGKVHRHKGESKEEREIRVALVDFDWAGKDGKARYPSGISFGGTIAWPDGVKPRGLITKEHDLYWLRTWTDLLA